MLDAISTFLQACNPLTLRVFRKRGTMPPSSATEAASDSGWPVSGFPACRVSQAARQLLLQVLQAQHSTVQDLPHIYLVSTRCKQGCNAEARNQRSSASSLHVARHAARRHQRCHRVSEVAAPSWSVHCAFKCVSGGAFASLMVSKGLAANSIAFSGRMRR